MTMRSNWCRGRSRDVHPEEPPPLAERQKPGLSETLVGPKHPAHCQQCGTRAGMKLRRWRECDPWDKPTPTVVVLCDRCSTILIDDHPRLYQALEINQPSPGCMGICVGCAKRNGTSCTVAKWGTDTWSGKPNVHWAGVDITVETPSAVHLQMSPRRFSRWVNMWPKPASHCSQRVPFSPTIAATNEDEPRQ